MPQPWRERADSPEGEGEITFAGTTHRPVLGSAQQLLTSVSEPADLLLFRIESDPGVPAPVIASEPPPLSSEVIMIGQGRDRDPEQMWWDANWYEVPENDPNMIYSGYMWSGERALRWGTNKVLASSRGMRGSYGRVTWSFWSDFTWWGDTTEHEAQAAGGDSGGGADRQRTELMTSARGACLQYPLASGAFRGRE